MNKKTLIIMNAISFIVMFFIGYSMVYVSDHFYLNINKIYMALLMVGAMGLINVLVMYNMYQKKSHKIWVTAISLVLIIGSLLFIRSQYAIGNEEFLRSMIPHHSSAILMCEKANITDPEIIDLCDSIVQTQREEILIMKDLLN